MKLFVVTTRTPEELTTTIYHSRADAEASLLEYASGLGFEPFADGTFEAFMDNFVTGMRQDHEGWELEWSIEEKSFDLQPYTAIILTDESQDDTPAILNVVHIWAANPDHARQRALEAWPSVWLKDQGELDQVQLTEKDAPTPHLSAVFEGNIQEV